MIKACKVITIPWKLGTKDSQCITQSSPAVKDSFEYEWEITDVLTDEGMCLPCHLTTDKDPEIQICHTFDTLKQLLLLSR